MLKSYKFFIPLIFIIGCNRNYEIIKIDDNVYVKKIYNDEGNLTDSMVMVNGRLNGFQRKINYKDSLWGLLEYKNDSPTGKTTWYYFNNQIKETGRRENGKRIGEWIHYYPNGVASNYLYYHYSGVLRYRRHYDKTGNLKLQEGKGFVWMTSILLENDTIPLGDTLEFNLDIAHPPNCRVNLFIQDLEEDQFKGRYDEGDFYRLYKKRSYFKFPFENPGDRKMRVVWIIKDTVTEKVENGFYDFLLHVK